MRVVEADNIFPTLASLPLDANQFARIDVVAVLRRVGTSVPAAHCQTYDAHLPVDLPEQDAAAFMWIRFLAMLPNRLKVSLSDFQHRTLTTGSEQRRNLFVVLCDSVVKRT